MKRSDPLIFFSKLLILIVLLLISMTFQQCNYKMNEEYFQEVKPPSAIIPFELTLDNEGDTLFIFEQTSFLVQLKVQGLEIIDVGIFVDTNSLYQGYSPEVTIRINPLDYTPGYYTLSALFLTNSGSGSVADQAGAEGYLFERQWTLAIDSREPNPPKPKYLINENGYLCIHWSPTDHFAFKSYSIIVNDQNSFRKFETFYRYDTLIVDSCYNYGNLDAYSRINIFGNENDYHISDYAYYYANNPQLYYEVLSTDSMRVSWPAGKGESVYKLIGYGGTILADGIQDTFAILSNPPIGRSYTYRFEYSPKKGNCVENVRFLTNNYVWGQEITGIRSDYAFNPLENTTYIPTHDSLLAIETETLVRINSVFLPNLDTYSNVSTQYGSTKIAVRSQENIFILDNSQFLEYTFFPNNHSQDFLLEHFYYTANSKIACARNGLYILYDVATEESEITITYDPYPTIVSRNYVGTHRDGEFVTFVLENGIQHYRITNQLATLIYEDNESYNSLLYSETNPDILYLSRSNTPNIEIRNANDFSLISEINLPESVFIRNIDPISQHMLLTTYSAIKVLEIETQEILISINSSVSRSKLYDSKLFLESGYCIDIKPFLQ
jgi:hypothetical protein